MRIMLITALSQFPSERDFIQNYSGHSLRNVLVRPLSMPVYLRVINRWLICVTLITVMISQRSAVITVITAVFESFRNDVLICSDLG